MQIGYGLSKTAVIKDLPGWASQPLLLCAVLSNVAVEADWIMIVSHPQSLTIGKNRQKLKNLEILAECPSDFAGEQTVTINLKCYHSIRLAGTLKRLACTPASYGTNS